MSTNDLIIIKGARENNLKNIDLEIPKNKNFVLATLSLKNLSLRSRTLIFGIGGKYGQR